MRAVDIGTGSHSDREFRCRFFLNESLQFPTDVPYIGSAKSQIFISYAEKYFNWRHVETRLDILESLSFLRIMLAFKKFKQSNGLGQKLNGES